jgi:hypothetical protein
MSLLTPLYVLGLLAVSLPIVFHLIRRAPKGEFQFSSLMFLSPSPPRLTRRSRLDNLFLLLLRGMIIGLLAFAFARPFLRQEVPLDPSAAEQQRVAIVVDSSASMKRGDLWQQAVAVVDQTMAELRPYDQAALFACDNRLRTLISFEDMAQIEPGQRRSVVIKRLAALRPGWGGTYLGPALLEVVEIVKSSAEPAESTGGKPAVDRQTIPTARRVLLVSDLQQGSHLDAIADHEWPNDVPLDLRAVATPQQTNAGMQLLADAPGPSTVGTREGEASAAAGELRVRVLNDRESSADQFQIQWVDTANQPAGPPQTVYVPAGESRVARVALPAADSPLDLRLRLAGDSSDFDNSLYFASRPSEEVEVVYLGTAARNDPSGLSYYLDRAIGAFSSSRPLGGILTSLRAVSPAAPLDLRPPTTTRLVVVADEPTADQTQALRQYAAAGGTVLWVLRKSEPSAALAELLGAESLSVEEADVDGYTMVGQIAFDHPLFSSMAGPQFNDFTQIYFWAYRRLAGGELPEALVIARFENGDPAILERRIDAGRIVLFTSGWQPSDSQLALSWKFVLMMSALVDDRRARLADRLTYVVNESVPLEKRGEAAADVAVVKPDGTTVLLEDGAREFSDTDQPGIYRLNVGGQMELFAVNLDPAESRTAPLAVETVEQLGARLVNSTAIVENNVAERHKLRDAQLESRQKVWQWLIVAALCACVCETCVAGWITRRAHG